MIKSIAHISLAALVYFSSLGVLLNAHFCKGELKHLSAYLPAERCHDMQEAAMPADCPMHQQNKHCEAPTPEDEKDCCDNSTEYFKNDHEQQFEFSVLEWSPQLTAALLSISPLDLPGTDRRTVEYLNYKPPLLVCDRPVSLQTFLC